MISVMGRPEGTTASGFGLGGSGADLPGSRASSSIFMILARIVLWLGQAAHGELEGGVVMAGCPWRGETQSAHMSVALSRGIAKRSSR